MTFGDPAAPTCALDDVWCAAPGSATARPRSRPQRRVTVESATGPSRSPWARGPDDRRPRGCRSPHDQPHRAPPRLHGAARCQRLPAWWRVGLLTIVRRLRDELPRASAGQAGQRGLVLGRSPAGRAERCCDRNVVRARLSWVATASDDVPNITATSPPLNPMTSRSTRTARPRGLKACTAAMKASDTDSRVSMRDSGPGDGSGRPSSSASGYGCSQVTGSVPLGGGAVSGGSAAACGRRRVVRRWLRQVLVARR